MATVERKPSDASAIDEKLPIDDKATVDEKGSIKDVPRLPPLITGKIDANEIGDVSPSSPSSLSPPPIHIHRR